MKPPPFKNDEIVKKAEALIDEYAEIRGKQHLVKFGFNFDRVYEDLIYPKYGIVLDEQTDLGSEDREKILGFFEPLKNKASIDLSLRDDPRRTFTRWHEVGGHGILQGEWLRKQLRTGIVTTDHDLSPETTKVLERQANLFAAHAAAPTWLVIKVIENVFQLKRLVRYIGPGRYCLSPNGASQYYNVSDLDDLCRVMARHIQSYFGYLSKEALGYRIRDIGIVTDCTDAGRGLRLHRKAVAV